MALGLTITLIIGSLLDQLRTIIALAPALNGYASAFGKDGEGVQRILNSLAILKDIALLGRPSIER